MRYGLRERVRGMLRVIRVRYRFCIKRGNRSDTRTCRPIRCPRVNAATSPPQGGRSRLSLAPIASHRSGIQLASREIETESLKGAIARISYLLNNINEILIKRVRIDCNINKREGSDNGCFSVTPVVTSRGQLADRRTIRRADLWISRRIKAPC